MDVFRPSATVSGLRLRTSIGATDWLMVAPLMHRKSGTIRRTMVSMTSTNLAL